MFDSVQIKQYKQLYDIQVMVITKYTDNIQNQLWNGAQRYYGCT